MASAEADPVSLYLASDGNEANEFKRTSSRLIEMSSESYLALPHGRKDSDGQRVEHRAGGNLTTVIPGWSANRSGIWPDSGFATNARSGMTTVADN